MDHVCVVEKVILCIFLLLLLHFRRGTILLRLSIYLLLLFCHEFLLMIIASKMLYLTVFGHNDNKKFGSTN